MKKTKVIKKAASTLEQQEKEAARAYSTMSSSATGSGVLLHDVTFDKVYKAGTEIHVVGFACYGPSLGQAIIMLAGHLRIIRMNHLMVRG